MAEINAVGATRGEVRDDGVAQFYELWKTGVCMDCLGCGCE